jgi:DNA-binding transcriptional ArsR family regulator
MNEFIALRTRAREKRDTTIAHARQEYEATLVQIASLEQDLLGRESSRHKKISASIESVIPNGRPFTTVDILAGLEAIDPGRVWRKRSIDNHLSRLRERGLVRRMRKAKGTEPALYVRVGADVAKLPFEDMTLPEVIRAVLTRPMTQTELTVRMLEAGYETTMSKPVLRNAVGVELRKCGYRNDGGKWVSDSR